MKEKVEDEDWDRLNEHIKIRQFELGACLPISWKSTSYGLKHAADRLYDCYHDATLRILERLSKDNAETEQENCRPGESRILKGMELEDHQDSQLISAYFLLIGYAMENLLKGTLMLKHPDYFKPESGMSDICSHKLKSLCSRCGVSVTAKEDELLDRLTRYVEWQGKYPIPLKEINMYPIKKNNGTWETGGEGFRGRQTQKEVDRLYLKILNYLETTQ